MSDITTDVQVELLLPHEIDDAFAPANPVLEFLIGRKLSNRERSIQIVAKDAGADTGAPRHRPQQLFERQRVIEGGLPMMRGVVSQADPPTDARRGE